MYLAQDFIVLTIPQTVFQICNDFRHFFGQKAFGQLVDYFLQVLLCMSISRSAYIFQLAKIELITT